MGFACFRDLIQSVWWLCLSPHCDQIPKSWWVWHRDGHFRWKRETKIISLPVRQWREAKICALGGHGFPVLSPTGNWPISKVSVASYPILVHETALGEKIKQSGFISSMDRFGGVNYTMRSLGGYRNQANCLVKIQAKNLVLAISLSWEFFENRFTGLVFGAERWINDSRDGIVPESFLEMVSIWEY